MKELFSLGELYVSDFLAEGQEPRASKNELKLMMDDNGAVRLSERKVDHSAMWGKYWYNSQINNSMLIELGSIVKSICSIYKLQDNDLWIDCACNDGGLFSFVPKNLLRVGIDPVEDRFKIECQKHCDLVIQDYFSAEVFQKSKFGKYKAKIFTSIAMFYDLEHPEVFIKDVEKVLDDNGLWVMQLSYTPAMLYQLAFDNILHEHFYYYSLFNIKKLLENNGFKVMDCQLNDTNGGSFRLYIMKQGSNEKVFSSQPYRDICQFRINSLLEYEKTLKLDEVETWMKFYQNILHLKEQVVSFIKGEKEKGKTIYGYGASTKGNSLLQFFGLNNTLITAIAERNTYKWGLKTVGTNIPICSEDEMRKSGTKLLLVLPWHFINEFKEREIQFLQNGGKFIIPCPKFEIIGL